MNFSTLGYIQSFSTLGYIGGTPIPPPPNRVEYLGVGPDYPIRPTRLGLGIGRGMERTKGLGFRV